jgi:squalene synthase HpnC
MKLSKEQLQDLTRFDGGQFSVSNLEQAYSFCTNITKSHYENFPVASILLPSKQRKFIYPIYAFARIADDIADEIYDLDPQEKINLLDSFEKLISSNVFAQKLENKTPSNQVLSNNLNPIFLALHDVINQNKIPLDCFHRLILAFKSDSDFHQAESWKETYEYCNNSANPVGEIILHLFDEADSEKIILSNHICTGLQLINFWQDLSKDLINKRYYIPKYLLKKYDIERENLLNCSKSHKLELVLEEILQETENQIKSGEKLYKILKNYRLKFEIKITIFAAYKMINLLKLFKSRLVNERPKLSKIDFVMIVFKSIFQN